MAEAKGTKTALLLIDVINTFDFPGAKPLIRAAKAALPRIEALVRTARAARVPIVFVNDNFGRWTSDFKATVKECSRPERPGHAICTRLAPKADDYFVLKPQHSGFYGTPLTLLLDHLEVDTLVLAGFATDICVLFTANDAHMRGFQIVVPSDCGASNSMSATRSALRHVRTVLGGTTPRAEEIDFEAFRGWTRKPRGQTF